MPTIAELTRLDLHRFDVLVSAVSLPDGTGLDVLASVRGIRSEPAVLLCGESSDTVLALEAIRSGALDFLVNSGPNLSTLPLDIEKCLVHQRMKVENERLQRELSHSLAELSVKNRQLQTMIHQLEVMTRTDELTGLCNRRWLNLKLDELWGAAARLRQPLACLMLDLDEFKYVNDAHGHQRGDDVLRLASSVIEASCRPGDVAARYGGDEFCILMPNTSWSEARRVAHRIVQEFREQVRSLGTNHRGASVSIGVAQNDLSRPESGDQLVSHADLALYQAKAAGKRRVCIFGAPSGRAAAGKKPASAAA